MKKSLGKQQSVIRAPNTLPKVSRNRKMAIFLGSGASENSCLRKSGMEFAIHVPENWKWNFHFHSRHLRMEFAVPVPEVQKLFPLTPALESKNVTDAGPKQPLRSLDFLWFFMGFSSVSLTNIWVYHFLQLKIDFIRQLSVCEGLYRGIRSLDKAKLVFFNFLQDLELMARNLRLPCQMTDLRVRGAINFFQPILWFCPKRLYPPSPRNLGHQKQKRYLFCILGYSKHFF